MVTALVRSAVCDTLVVVPRGGRRSEMVSPGKVACTGVGDGRRAVTVES